MDEGAGSYRRYIAGDDKALAEIIELYRNGLILFINGFVKNIDTAEEITEDVFFILAAKKPHYKGKSTFKTWLYAIGRNEALRYLRKNRMEYADIDSVCDKPDLKNDPETELLKGERNQILHRCMLNLKKEYVQALQLYYFESFTTEEIAVVLRKSVHSVETLLYRARQKLKSELEKEGITNENL